MLEGLDDVGWLGERCTTPTVRPPTCRSCCATLRRTMRPSEATQCGKREQLDPVRAPWRAGPKCAAVQQGGGWPCLTR